MRKSQSRGLPPFLVVVGLMVVALLAACDGFQVPVPPADEEPAESSITEAIEPPAAEDLPGAKDLAATGEPSEGGLLLGSPAFDMFLEIEGLPGESTDDRHKEWIEVLSFSHGLSQPAGGSLSTGGARSAERCDHSDFTIVKTLDKASPKLALYCCNGKHVEQVTLELCRDTEDRQTFMQYRLTDVMVSSVSVSGSAGVDDRPLEEVRFSYGRIEWTYTEFDPATGKPKGEVKTDWDVVTNSGG